MGRNMGGLCKEGREEKINTTIHNLKVKENIFLVMEHGCGISMTQAMARYPGGVSVRVQC